MNVMHPYFTLTLVVFAAGVWITGTDHILAESNVRQYQNHGLSFHYPSSLQPMGPSSTKKIQGMLNQQLKGMGNTQVSVVALDVLLDLPAFRIMIAKERFAKEPTPGYLIEERQHFLAEAQKRGIIRSYGDIKETQIAGHAAIEFQDLNQGAQGYGSRLRILCGKDTWNLTFTGKDRASYERYRHHINQIMNSLVISKSCA